MLFGMRFAIMAFRDKSFGRCSICTVTKSVRSTALQKHEPKISHQRRCSRFTVRRCAHSQQKPSWWNDECFDAPVARMLLGASVIVPQRWPQHFVLPGTIFIVLFRAFHVETRDCCSPCNVAKSFRSGCVPTDHIDFMFCEYVGENGFEAQWASSQSSI